MILNNQAQLDAGLLGRTLLIRDGNGEKQDRERIPQWDRVCPFCGAKDLIPAGSCRVCRNCGASNGCS